MAQIDYSEPVDVFWSVSGKRNAPKGAIRYKAMPSLSEAVRFVLGDGSKQGYAYAIDTNSARYAGGEIQALFDRPDFPLLETSGFSGTPNRSTQQET